jgi:hypothetical protein
MDSLSGGSEGRSRSSQTGPPQMINAAPSINHPLGFFFVVDKLLNPVLEIR